MTDITTTGGEAPPINDELARVHTRLAEMERINRNHLEDLTTIAEAIREEAESRDWCDEYGTFVDRLNDRTHGTWLEHCMASAEITFHVRVEGSGTRRDMDDFIDRIQSAIRSTVETEDNVDEVYIDY